MRRSLSRGFLSLNFWPFKRQIDPKKFNLLHFASMQWSDCWDGQGETIDGPITYVLLYEGKVVYREETHRTSGVTDFRIKTGREEYEQLATLGTRLRTIRAVCRHCAGIQKMPDFRTIVQLFPEEEAILRKHPQFLETYWEWHEEGFTLILVRKDELRCEVVLVKHAT